MATKKISELTKYSGSLSDGANIWFEASLNILGVPITRAVDLDQIQEYMGLGTLASQDADAVDITGGTIEGTTVGIMSPAAGKFTSLAATDLSVAGFVTNDASGNLGTITEIDIGDTNLSASDPLTLTAGVLSFDYAIDQDVDTTANVVFASVTTASLASVDSLLIQAGNSYHGYGGGSNVNYNHEFYGTASFDSLVELLSSATVGGDLTVTGDLIVNGTQFITNTETVEIEDNLLLINKNEVGTGVTAGLAGIEVERGSATNYQFIFQESDDTFRVGQVGSTQAVATREDSPTSNGFAYWNNSAKRFDTKALSVTDLSDFAEAVDDRVDTMLLIGTNGLTKSYNDGSNTLTLDLVQNLNTNGTPTFASVFSINGGGFFVNPGQDLYSGEFALMTFGEDSSTVAYAGQPFRFYWSGPDSTSGYGRLRFEDANHNLVALFEALGFVGDGSNLTGLSAAALASGVIPVGRYVSSGDPNADRILFWDDSAGAMAWLAPGNSLVITTTTFDTAQDIRTSAGPTFANMTLNSSGSGLFFATAGSHYIKHNSGSASSDTITLRNSSNADHFVFRMDGQAIFTRLSIGDSSPQSYAALQLTATDDPVFVLEDTGNGVGYWYQDGTLTGFGAETSFEWKTGVNFTSGPLSTGTVKLQLTSTAMTLGNGVNLIIADQITRGGDSDTYLLGENDMWHVWAGGIKLLSAVEDTQDSVIVGQDGNDVDLMVGASGGKFKVDFGLSRVGINMAPTATSDAALFINAPGEGSYFYFGGVNDYDTPPLTSLSTLGAGGAYPTTYWTVARMAKVYIEETGTYEYIPLYSYTGGE